MSHRVIAVCIALMMASISVAAVASNQDKAKAKKHFEVATRLYEVEDYKGAVVEFETSVRLYPTKNGYFNLANCYKALHRYDEALSAIDELERRFGKQLDSTMKRKTESLKSLIESLVGELTIVVSPPGAKVFLNGNRISDDRVRKPLRMGPGEYKVEARLDGYAPVVQTVTLHSQQRKKLDVSLMQLSGQLVVEADVDGASVVVDGALRGEAPLTLSVAPGEHLVEISVDGYAAETRTVETSANRTTRVEFTLSTTVEAVEAPVVDERRFPFAPLKIAGIAGTASAAVATGVFYGMAAKFASDFETYDHDFQHAATDAAADDADANRLDARDKTLLFSNLGLGFGIATGVLGAATVALFVLDRRLERPSDTSGLSLRGGALSVSF